MNEELTNEVLEDMKKCNGYCANCKAHVLGETTFEIRKLATALLEERAKPKDDVWEYAPDGITTADVYYGNNMLVSATPDHTFTREIPKTRARQIAEEIEKALSASPRYKTEVEIIESALNKYAEELEECSMDYLPQLLSMSLVSSGRF